MQFAINKAIHILPIEHFIRAHIVTALFKYLDTIIKFKLFASVLDTIQFTHVKYTDNYFFLFIQSIGLP